MIKSLKDLPNYMTTECMCCGTCIYFNGDLFDCEYYVTHSEDGPYYERMVSVESYCVCDYWESQVRKIDE